MLGGLAFRNARGERDTGGTDTPGATDTAGTDAGRVAGVAEGRLRVTDLPHGIIRDVATGDHISNPAFSATGKWLLFRNYKDLWLVSAAGGKPRRIVKGVGVFSWSPTRDVFAFTAGGELRAAEPAGGNPHVLVRQEAGSTITRVAWSPDGKWVAFERSSGGDNSAGTQAAGI